MLPKRHTLRELFFNHVGQTSPSPLGLEIQRAEGIFLYTPSGERIIDLVSGVSVSNVGHSNQEIVDAVCKQASDYMHLMVYGELVQPPQVLHAKLLADNLPGELKSVYYVNSGSEANEVALKLAKRATGRVEMISCKNSYHGSTHGVLSIMGSEFFKSSFRPLLPGISHIDFNNEEQLSTITERTACVIVEPVQAEAGVIIPQNNYLSKLRARCTETGTLLIFDEIQTGFGRTGSLFAMNKYGVVPDIVTFAKALGGGMPLGAVVASPKLMKCFTFNPVLGHITTFGGHPVSCAAALAALKILLRESWIEDVEVKAKVFIDAISNHPKVAEIRHSGLLIAVDLGKEEYASRILQLLLDEGIMSDWFLFNPTSFRIAPPLCITKEEAIDASEKILNALNKL